MPLAVCNNAWQRFAKPLTSSRAHTPAMTNTLRNAARTGDPCFFAHFFPPMETHYLIPHKVRHITQSDSSSQDRDSHEEIKPRRPVQLWSPSPCLFIQL